MKALTENASDEIHALAVANFWIVQCIRVQDTVQGFNPLHSVLALLV